MGLDCTHGAFNGAYSAFNRLRQAVCKAAGGRYPFFSDADRAYLETIGTYAVDNGRWYVPDEIIIEAWPGLYVFLSHSDCDGEISPEDCRKVALDLERLLDKVSDEPAGGHLDAAGGYKACVRKFIAGCRLAAAHGEALEFH